MNLEKAKKLNLPQSPGIYQFLNQSGEIIYIGKAANLKSRVLSYWQKSTEHSAVKYSMLKQVDRINLIETDSEIEALLLESNLIKKHQPRYNVVLRDDKRYTYIKVSVEEEWPRVFLARNLEHEGKYFGPFVSAEAARETLKVIRKIWPFRSCRMMPKKTCLYYRIGKCPGMCEGKITKKDYNKIIRQIILFLSGKKKEVVKNIKKEIKLLEKNGEDANSFKYQLLNLGKVIATANILSLQDKYASDVVELAKILNLPNAPERIEGYDISNIFGQEAVGSMVVFKNGEPDKNEYRKFKISSCVKAPSFAKASEDKSEDKPKGEVLVKKFGDVQMLAEILERRCKKIQPHPDPLLEKERGLVNIKKSKNFVPPSFLFSSLPLPEGEVGGGGRVRFEYWSPPDLIIIDGGKAQLNTALRVLKNFKLDIPVIAVSKGEGLRSAGAPDKIFFPGAKNPLELSLASPVLHLVKRVRDEAHRFAITYYRKLRGKKFFE